MITRKHKPPALLDTCPLGPSIACPQPALSLRPLSPPHALPPSSLFPLPILLHLAERGEDSHRNGDHRATTAAVLERNKGNHALLHLSQQLILFCDTAAIQQAGAEAGLLDALLRRRCQSRPSLPALTVVAATQHQEGDRMGHSPLVLQRGTKMQLLEAAAAHRGCCNAA